MTTESTSVPAPSGRGSTGHPAAAGAGPLSKEPGSPGPGTLTGPGGVTFTATGLRPLGFVPMGPQQDGADRVALPPRRRTAAPLRFALPLIAADWTGALLGTAVLDSAQHHLALIVPLMACVAVLNTYAGLYRRSGPRTALDELPALGARILIAWCTAAALLAALFPGHTLSLTALMAGSTTQLVVACFGRALVHGYQRHTARSRLTSALVVGAGPAPRRLAGLLARHPVYGLVPVGIVAPAHGDRTGDRTTDPQGEECPSEEYPAEADTDADILVPVLPVLSTIEEIHRAVIQNGVRHAVFLDDTRGGTIPGAEADRTGLVALFHEYGCATWFIGGIGGAGVGGAMSQHLWGFTCRRVPAPTARRGTLAKRLLDIAVAAPILLAISPVLLACALAVRFLDGPGVLFRQERIGQHGRPFTLLKFRTLRPADDHEAATRWSVANDRRMSPVGHLLRRTSMDELPQIWNVLRGDMSLVGPRPERPFFVANFSKTHPGYAARHRMPVGITGLAQVHGLRGDTSIEDRSRFDNHYIDHWSLWQDVCIIIRTALSLVRPAGS
ncbi:sugar transferase [Streptomyces sp. NBC_01716]|uniref:sugar transferase n=1 Tax=Streptomyces sp. NBC_01716 TaxID=2975917 RepID=UPI002E376137|nr:sugar transferase [Streptomyces sp. NBC_01716]